MQAILDICFRQDVFFLFGMRKVISKTTYTTKRGQYCQDVLREVCSQCPVKKHQTHLNLQRCAPRAASLVDAPPGVEEPA